MSEVNSELLYENKAAYEMMSEEDIVKAYEFSEDYKAFLQRSKTERDSVKEILNRAVENNFRPFTFSDEFRTGDKLFFNNRGKAVILAVIGEKTVDHGVKILASHIDCPRLDLKPRPLYEEGGIAYFKTHYYGGIKKYQWPTIQLALHGTVIRSDGTSVDIQIGEDEADPVFYITDLLPHLDRGGKSMAEAIPAEHLNLLAGSIPVKEEENNGIKKNVLDYLQKKYHVVEEDLLSAELCAVPAAKPRDVGLDRSMISAYGHDDRVCAFPSLRAILELDRTPEYTTVCVFADKEETGSNSNTGLDTNFLFDFVSELAHSQGVNARQTWYNTKCLSADVNACYDPAFPDAFEKMNSAFLNHGVVITKYTGSRGKNGTNDANAEFFGEIRGCFNRNRVCWQSAELGKTDVGGGGTVARYIAKLNADVIDIGVPVLSMHAPVEVISKLDLYHAYLGFQSFIRG